MWRDFISRDKRVSPVQILILLQLRKKSMYGYEILKSLREQFADIWEPKTGTVYPALRSLETRGFIQTELREEKEFYSLTEKGEEIMKDAERLFEGDLEFAGKYFRLLSPLHRGRIMEKMMERFSSGHLPQFLPLFLLSSPNGVQDKEIRLRNLKMIRKVTEKGLHVIDEAIKKLESETSGKNNFE